MNFNGCRPNAVQLKTLQDIHCQCQIHNRHTAITAPWANSKLSVVNRQKVSTGSRYDLVTKKWLAPWRVGDKCRTGTWDNKVNYRQVCYQDIQVLYRNGMHRMGNDEYTCATLRKKSRLLWTETAYYTMQVCLHNFNTNQMPSTIHAFFKRSDNLHDEMVTGLIRLH